MTDGSQFTQRAMPFPLPPAVHSYLLIMGLLSTAGMALALLILLGYLAQQVFLVLAECVHLFSILDPVTRLLVLALVTVLVGWRYSSHMKVKYGQKP